MRAVLHYFATRRLVAAASLLALSLPAAWGVTRLTLDDDLRIASRVVNPKWVRLEQIFWSFGSFDTDIIAVLKSDDFFTPPRGEALRKLTEALEAHPPITDTQSMVDGRRFQGKLPIPLFPARGLTETTLEKTRDVALSNPIIFKQTISHDGRTTLVLARLNEEAYQDAAEVEQIRDFVERTARELMEPVGVEVRMTGTPAVRVEVIRATRQDLLTFGAVAFAAALPVGMVLVRSVSIPLIGLPAAAFCLFWTVGFAGLLDVPVNVMTIGLLIALGYITIAGVLFALVACRRASGAGGDGVAAAVASTANFGIAQIAVAAGSLTWLSSDGIGVAGLGIVAAAGSILSLLAVALIALPVAGLSLVDTDEPPGPSPADRAAAACVAWATSRPGIVGVIALAATAALGAAALRTRPNLLLEDNLPTHGNYAETMRHCGRAMGGVYHVAVVIRLPEGTTLDMPSSEAVHRDVQSLFLRTEPLQNPLSLVNVAEGMPTLGNGWGPIIRYVTNPVRPSVKMFLNLENRESLATARIADIGTRQVEEVANRLDAGLEELRKKHPGYEFELTGMPIVAARALNASLRKLVTVTALGAAVAVIVLAIGFRSLALAAIGGCSAAFVLAATVGAMSLPGASLSYGNVVVPQLAIMLGLVGATQYAAAARSSDSADRAGATLASTTAAILMFLAGSVVLLASEIHCRRVFAWSSCIALAAALIAQWVVVPALTRLLTDRRSESTAA